MSNKVTGSDVLNKDVSTLVAQNQSANETNISASLNTRTVTAQANYTANKDTILGDTHRKSTKKKTFSVFETKQAVTPITPEVIAKTTTELDSLTPQEIIYLEQVSGMTLTSDSDLEVARQMQNALVSGDIHASRDPKSLGDDDLYVMPDFIRLGDTQFSADGVDLTSRSLSSGESFAKDASLFSSTLTPPTLGQVDITETEVGSLSAGFGEVKDGLPYGGAIGKFAGDMSIENFQKAKALIEGPFGDFNSCDLGFGGGMWDFSLLLQGLLDLLKFNFDLGCLNDLLGQMGGPNLEELLNESVSLGQIKNADILVEHIGPAQILHPKKLVKEVARNAKMPPKNFGTQPPIPEFDSDLDSLRGKFQLSKSDVWGTTDDVMDITDIASYPNDDTISYAYGGESVDLLRSLPTEF